MLMPLACTVHEIYQQLPNHSPVGHLPCCTIYRSKSSVDWTWVLFYLNQNMEMSTIAMDITPVIKEEEINRDGLVLTVWTDSFRSLRKSSRMVTCWRVRQMWMLIHEIIIQKIMSFLSKTILCLWKEQKKKKEKRKKKKTFGNVTRAG